MKEIYIIRHAESISNAGERTDSHDTIPLSEKGRGQAKELAETLNIIPELIVVSPYTRTRETAEPFIAKHPSVPVETWNVHEFTYLDPKIYNGTKAEERFDAARNYWMNASVHHKEAEEVESFFELTERMGDFLEKLRRRPEKTITVFSHGRFILGLKLYMQKIKETGRNNLTDMEIIELKQLHADGIISTISRESKFPIDNVSVHKIEL